MRKQFIIIGSKILFAIVVFSFLFININSINSKENYEKMHSKDNRKSEEIFVEDLLIYHIETVGRYAFVSNISTLCILDLKKSHDISIVFSYKIKKYSGLEEFITGLYIFDNYLCVIIMYHHTVHCYQESLLLFDISNPLEPKELSLIEIYGFILDVCISGSYLYINYDFNLYIYDIRNGYIPILVGIYFFDIRFTHIEIIDNVAYLVRYNILYICNITNPYEPVLMNNTIIYSPNGTCYLNIFQKNNYLLILGNNLTTILVDNPFNPIVISNKFKIDYPETISYSEDFCYVICKITNKYGMKIIDIKNPSNASIVYEQETNSSYLRDIGVYGYKAFISVSGGSLIILDIPGQFVSLGLPISNITLFSVILLVFFIRKKKKKS